MAFCPNCRAEYREGVYMCLACGVDLVPWLPPRLTRTARILSSLKRFVKGFRGTDDTPPRLESFLLEQPPDWRHSVLAFAVCLGMAIGSMGNVRWLQQAVTPITYSRGGAPLGPDFVMAPPWDWWTPARVAGVVVGCAVIGLVGALIARRRERLWGPAALLSALAIRILWLAATRPYGKPSPIWPGSPEVTLTWRFSVSISGLLLIAVALASAVGGGILSHTRIRRWAVGITTVCAISEAVGWTTAPLIMSSILFRFADAVLNALGSAAFDTVLSLPYAISGLWTGYAMRRRGCAWGSALGLFALYAVLFGGFRSHYLQPVGTLEALLPYARHVLYPTLLGALGGLIGQWLWQRKARRRAAALTPAARLP